MRCQYLHFQESADDPISAMEKKCGDLTRTFVKEKMLCAGAAKLKKKVAVLIPVTIQNVWERYAGYGKSCCLSTGKFVELLLLGAGTSFFVKRICDAETNTVRKVRVPGASSA